MSCVTFSQARREPHAAGRGELFSHGPNTTLFRL